MVLHWAMTALQAQFVACHARTDAGSNTMARLASTACPKAGRIYEFALEQYEPALQEIAQRVARTGSPLIVSRSVALARGLTLGCAMAVPLFDPLTPGLACGCLVALCADGARTWRREEQELLALCAPLLALHAQRSQLAEQSALLNALMPPGEAAGTPPSLPSRVTRVLREMKGEHGRQCAALVSEHREATRRQALSLPAPPARALLCSVSVRTTWTLRT